MASKGPHCDAPECPGELIALVRGVGLCELHFERVAQAAAVQRVNPGALPRPVILALLRSHAPAPAPFAEAEAEAEETETSAADTRVVRPGFYWVPVDGGWTIIEVGRGTFKRMGAEGVFRLDEAQFARMVPIRVPDVMLRDAELRRIRGDA